MMIPSNVNDFTQFECRINVNQTKDFNIKHEKHSQ